MHNFEKLSWKDKAGNTSWPIASWHRPRFIIFALHFSAFPINQTKTFIPFESCTTPLKKCLVVNILIFVHIHVFMGIYETTNNNKEDFKQQICFKFYPFNYKKACKSIQTKICFGKL